MAARLTIAVATQPTSVGILDANFIAIFRSVVHEIPRRTRLFARDHAFGLWAPKTSDNAAHPPRNTWTSAPQSFGTVLRRSDAPRNRSSARAGATLSLEWRHTYARKKARSCTVS